MGKHGRRKAIEEERLVADFERSGLRRREYCERRGIGLSTLDWYRRRVRASRNAANLVPVSLIRPVPPAGMSGVAAEGFTLVLGNARRIESGWNFDESALTRLIRIAGAA